MATAIPQRNKQKWSPGELDLLIGAFLKYQRESEGVGEVDWDDVPFNIPGRTVAQCCTTLMRLNEQGNYFATIEEVWTTSLWENPSIAPPVDLDVRNNWDDCKTTVCRVSPPTFDRRHLNGGNGRNPKEFFSAAYGASLDSTTVNNTVTTVNDTLVPVDIFGRSWKGADKAHLLPKDTNEALTWQYPACAVLGLEINNDVLNSVVVKKAILGSIDKKPKPVEKFPGIRNLLCNIIRLTGQASNFDSNPHVFIFPILNIEATRAWTGTGYDAIVVCESATVAQTICMTSVDVWKAKSASLAEIETAVGLASTICQFLAYSVLLKPVDEVSAYQKSITQKDAHESFLKEKKIKVPVAPFSLPNKPVFKVTFYAHDDQTLDEGDKHPAPDPMLLAFKTCNNWCRKYAGFRMVAAAEPVEEDDDLSEEGQKNLQDYLAWQAEEEKSRQHEDIMTRFGGREGAVRVPPTSIA
jgi:hypothetical protein